MAIIKCKMCGGDIILAEDKTYGTCEYCGSTMTFPRVSDEQRLNLFNRANHFRRLNEFDKAIAAYDKILDQDDADAEAHWGAVLSRYGIEYVEDPVTHERIPTCHRVQLGSILTDADYLAALEHAPDTRSRDIYESEAKRIAEIQKGILAISAQEKPYDVFICYKETDDKGSRTKDSTLAQEIYYQLTNEGYKVFFSRITLEDKLGQQYEPYIFAALNSAKVMLVIGTRAEYFNAVWVKNEWSRYLDLMKRDRNKLLIPCYRDMDPYDLPEELSALQSQDMSKIGFMQDIIRGVKKVLNAGKEPKPEVVAVPTAGPGVASLHKRAVLFLEDSDWDSASEYFDRILDIDPEYAPAYIGKVQVTNKVRKEDGLARCAQPLKDNSDYQKALRFASEQQKAIYEGYNRAIEDRLERERKEAIYREADALEKRAATEADFLAAAKKYDDVGDIRDAKERAANCRAKADAAKQAAERQAKEYKKQLEMEREERKRKEEEDRIAAERRQEEERIAAERREREQRIEAEKRRKRNMTIATVAVIALLLGVVAYFINDKVIQPKRTYDAAQALLDSGEYDAAVDAFTAMDGYDGSAMKVKEAWYRKGQFQLESGFLKEAKESFSKAGDYLDSAEKAQNITTYLSAREAEKQQDYVSAHRGYTALGGFLDASERAAKIDQSLYESARAMYQAGDVGAAYDAFVQLGSYLDSADIVAKIDSDYSSALEMWKSGDKAGAEAVLVDLGSTSDASEKLEALREEIADDAANAGDYDKALIYYAKIKQTDSIQAKIDTAKKARAYAVATAALAAGDVSTAQTNYKEAGDYQDAEAQADRAATYLEASTQMKEGHYEKARQGFASLGDYLDTAEALEACNNAIYRSAGERMSAGDIQGAYEAYTLLEGYSDSAERAAGIKSNYQAAVKLFEAGNYDEAASSFEALGNYSDSPAKVSESRYRLAGALTESGKYTQAAELYRTLEGYKDSTDLAKTTAYAYAKALRDKGNLSEAAEVLKSLGDYEDAAEQLVTISAQIADKALAEKNYAVALSAYQRLQQTDEIKAKEYELAQLCYDEGHYAEATSAYELLGKYELSLSKLPIARYAWADQLFNQSNYAEAAEQFALLGDMTDSAERVKQSTYMLGAGQLSNGEYDVAKSTFQTILGYSDADVQVHECDYQKAAHFAEIGDYEAAQSLFGSLGKYSDSVTRAAGCVYARADILFEKGEYAKAYELYSSIKYQDSADKAKQSAYLAAQELFDVANYAGAEAIYVTLLDYKDSDERARICRLYQGDALMTAGKYNEALKYYKDLDYQDSETKTLQCHYQLGHAAQVSGDVDGAVGEYAFSLNIPDTRVALMDIARDYTATNEIEKAVQVLWLLREDSSAIQKLNEIAALKAQSGEKGIALLSWCATGDDKAEMLVENANSEGYTVLKTVLSKCNLLPKMYRFVDDINYTFACAAFENKEFDAAVDAFNMSSDYKDAMTQASKIQYQVGTALLASGEYTKALLAFEALWGYSDSADQVKSFERLLTESVSCGHYHSVVLKSDCTMITAGNNEAGQLNVSSWHDISAVSCGEWHTVGLKSDGTAVATGKNSSGQCDVGSWSDIVAVSCGKGHTVGLKSDGTVVATGNNEVGQRDVSSWSDIIAVSCGQWHTVGLKSDGTVVATGKNSDGQCDVSGWRNIVAISCGYWHTVGLKSDGTVVAVGSNSNGQCDVRGWRDIVAVSCGERHTVGLKSNGTVIAVGDNEDGQCEVKSWRDIIAISCGGFHIVGLKSDGTVVAVGNNNFGQCNVSDWRIGLSQIPVVSLAQSIGKPVAKSKTQAKLVNGWYLSEDENYAIQPSEPERKSDGAYTLRFKVQVQSNGELIYDHQVEIKAKGELSLAKDSAIQDFTTGDNGKYRFTIVCEQKEGASVKEFRKGYSFKAK